MRMDYENIDRDALVDIRDVKVDTSLPKEERIRDFIRQIKNPYLFRHGKYVVKLTFSETDVTLEDLMADYIRSKCAAG
ncbi:DUF6870 family protein [uncultured Dysosmobacter sp.]|uniref:DUF6870 family protein n=1 Tax=uncultured Dysosmobacter sp. TaxID=2591384 RepID=UPI00260A374E|nr:hypothetical protein [uncultured Dysosmobacter sp.]